MTAAAVMVLTGVMTFVVGRVAGTHTSLGLVTAGVLGAWPVVAGAVLLERRDILH